MGWITEPEAWAAFFTLTVLEIVLGIDNIIFIAILSSRLEPKRQALARRLGLLAAMATRLLLLFAIAWIVRLSRPLFEVLGHPFSGRDLVLLGGGLFLIAKATREIHHRIEEADGESRAASAPAGFAGMIVQIALLDVVFSLDSVITAVGMAERVGVMVAAIVVAVLVMMAASGPIAAFVERHPSVKMLALAFLVLIGTMLVADGLGHHVPKGYAYFAMAFSAAVEFLNLKAGTRRPARGRP